MKFIDLTGKRYGKLTVLERVQTSKKTKWKCKCDCGNEVVVASDNLRSGHSRSCGCLKLEEVTKHGQWNTRIYRIYYAMKQRCNNPKCAAYGYYGGRGIKVCIEWENDFQTFYNWAMSHGYADDLSIDRIDVNGNYEPSNCRWATATEQSFNKTKGKDNSLGIVGVSRRKDTGKYMAYISKEGKRHRLGDFETLEEAVRAREEAEKKYY